MASLRWQDKVFIARFNRGHKQVLGPMYAQYRVDMVSLANALLFDKAQAEDVVHEVFARLAQNGDKIRITHNLHSYLLQAVANTARNYNRSLDNTERKAEAQREMDQRVIPSPVHEVTKVEYSQKLEAALEQLPYDQREVVLLRHYGGMRFKAIAKCQGTSVSTVQGRYRYGLDKLRSILGGDL